MDVENRRPLEPLTTIDLSSALRWVDGDLKLLVELAEVFVQDGSKRMKELEEAVKRGSADQVRRAAHSLKGMVSCFGAHQAKSLAQEMEELGRNGCLTVARDLLPTVLREFSQVIGHLKHVDWQAIS